MMRFVFCLPEKLSQDQLIYVSHNRAKHHCLQNCAPIRWQPASSKNKTRKFGTRGCKVLERCFCLYKNAYAFPRARPSTLTNNYSTLMKWLQSARFCRFCVKYYVIALPTVVFDNWILRSVHCCCCFCYQVAAGIERCFKRLLLTQGFGQIISE